MSKGWSHSNEEALTPSVLLWAAVGSIVGVMLVVFGHYNDTV